MFRIISRKKLDEMLLEEHSKGMNTGLGIGRLFERVENTGKGLIMSPRLHYQLEQILEQNLKTE